MSPRSIKPGLHRQDICELGEGPFWHDGKIWWVDIERGLLQAADEHGHQVERIEFGQRIGAAVPAENQTLLVALEREVACLDLKTRSCTTFARPTDVSPDHRFNDGQCDPKGRFLVGTTSLSGTKKASALYSVRADASVQRLLGELSISNGLAWSANGRTLYFIDTPELCVQAYDYDLATGSLSNARVILRFAEKEGYPDGMTIDREGQLWIGFWDGWAVRCYRPETGICENIVPLPCARATSCCFGGANLNRLFITTARVGLKASELAQQPLAGSLFVCDPETSGFSTQPFIYE